jgi:pyrimidine-nucleoside phosphorylase/thymidine phosphorylase
MRAVDLIRQKRDGQTLTTEEIEFLVGGLIAGRIPEYQWSALLMAILWRGLDPTETAALTRAMADSGVRLDHAHIPGPKVDKHSTGGVGDKTSLVIAPLAAACGVVVPMISGRALGHTGGTLDKLDAIPGFRTRIALPEALDVLGRCGAVLIGQTESIAPADRILYALRDATATVESLPLITSSILSKKLAEALDGLVLDVKTGHGAFLPDLDQARALAAAHRETGRHLGLPVVTLITDMDQPLGLAVGNALEVAECVDVLRGAGPNDLRTLCLELAAEMVLLGRLAPDHPAALALATARLDSGEALDRFRRIVELQGGDPRAIDDPARLPRHDRGVPVPAPATGFVTRLDARKLGQASMLLGAGRERVDSTIDPAAGFVLHRKRGDAVRLGEPVLTAYFDPSTPHHHRALRLAEEAILVEDSQPPAVPLVLERNPAHPGAESR